MQTVTSEQLAKELEGFDTMHTFTRRITNLAKQSNLVIVTARGDDTVMFSGALVDEFDFLKGGDIFMAKENDDYYPYIKPKPNTRKIQAFWEDYKLYKWKFITTIRHVEFTLSNGSRKCFARGIIFSLNDL
jgi:tetrahydromethanopterin S-methyltransferase subunit F